MNEELRSELATLAQRAEALATENNELRQAQIKDLEGLMAQVRGRSSVKTEGKAVSHESMKYVYQYLYQGHMRYRDTCAGGLAEGRST